MNLQVRKKEEEKHEEISIFPIIKQAYWGVTLGGLRCLGHLRRVWGQAAFMQTMILSEAVAAAWKLLFRSPQEVH